MDKWICYNGAAGDEYCDMAFGVSESLYNERLARVVASDAPPRKAPEELPYYNQSRWITWGDSPAFRMQVFFQVLHGEYGAVALYLDEPPSVRLHCGVNDDAYISIELPLYVVSAGWKLPFGNGEVHLQGLQSGTIPTKSILQFNFPILAVHTSWGGGNRYLLAASVPAVDFDSLDGLEPLSDELLAGVTWSQRNLSIDLRHSSA